MKKVLGHTITKLVTAFAVTLFFSCKDNGDAVRKLNQKIEGPVAEGTGINLKYTDSGKVVARLKTPLMKDFANEPFPFEEFPEGVALVYTDEEGKESTIIADYGIRYKLTNLIDLRQNVVLVTSDSVTLKADQLYWDQANKWVFTDQPYTLITADGSTNKGDLFDSNEDFTDFVSLNNISKQYIKEDPEE